MKKLIIYSFLTITVLLLYGNSAKANPDLEIIRKRIISEMMKPAVDEIMIKNLMTSLREDGTWPNINYVDVSRTGFQQSEHLRNMVELSRAYKKAGSKFKGDKNLKNVICSSLNYWLSNNFICDNWWWNQIGTPDELIKILLIMDNDLTKEQISKTVAIVGRANLDASGARPSGDRVRIAGILAKNAVFQRDIPLFEATIKVIGDEIKFSTGRGIQYDYSFHHRTDRVTSTLSYGVSYAEAFAEWIALLSGTSYIFPEATLDLFIDYYLNGICQTMIYGKYPDPGAENRSISREGDLRPFSPLIPEILINASSYRKNELEKIVKIRKGLIKPDLSGNRFYWDSEYLSHQRPSFFTSVRMFSSRNNNMEMPYNEEGLMNHYYADGSNFISRTGREYFNIFPMFDWRKIPGTTVLQKPELPPENEIQKEGLTDFVGAVSDGNYGAATFDFKSPHDTLKAKKAWFFFDKEYVCLGAGISSPSNFPVATTLNQCLLRGDVIMMSGKTKTVLKQGVWVLENVRWILHDSVAYLFPEAVNVNLANKAATGNWFKINHQSDSPKKEVTKDVFKLWIDHGKQPENRSYQYIVVPSTSESEMSDITNNRHIDILSNNSDLQAVRNSELNLCQIIFYRAGSIKITPGIKIGIDSPGIVMIKTQEQTIKRISVSDPTRKLDKIHLTVSFKADKTGENFTTSWNELKKESEISIELPRDVYTGESVTIDI